MIRRKGVHHVVCVCVSHLLKRNQSSLLFLHSIRVARTAWRTPSSTGVSALRQHSSAATHPHTPETHNTPSLSTCVCVSVLLLEELTRRMLTRDGCVTLSYNLYSL